LGGVVTSVHIRLGLPEDIARCREIDLETQRQFVDAGFPEFFALGVIPDDVASRAFATGRIVVAEHDGIVAGWVFLTRSGDELCVGQIAVAPALQRRGIGSALMQSLLAEARSRGERSVVLSTQADVEWNRPWYERIGFEVVPPEQWTDDMAAIVAEQEEIGLHWETRVHMRLQLTPD